MQFDDEGRVQFTDEERAEIATEYEAIAKRLWEQVERVEARGNYDLGGRLRAQACDAEALVEAARIPDARRANALLSRIY
ncbi:hypothetical protein [Streptomyces noursei]|uniref:hypothetical protein n=1 Tax=Streptomyces noursei TaxID=1971 RepID=UPI0016731784|nr:hypothetical protein [Streptomyces noursei]MCZ1013978.1 hypothetical protein [Streptomyces noursei]